MRKAIFLGSSQEDLRDFPFEARRAAGFAIRQAQDGKKHPLAVPMKGFGGASVLEVRIDENTDTYRAVYTVAFADAIYVLHCFQKKSKSGAATPQRDIDLIKRRLHEAQGISTERIKNGEE